MRARVDAHRLELARVLEMRSMRAEPGLDFSHDRLRFVFPAVDDEPARAFGDP